MNDDNQNNPKMKPTFKRVSCHRYDVYLNGERIGWVGNFSHGRFGNYWKFVTNKDKYQYLTRKRAVEMGIRSEGLDID